ncbi:DUF262 domain-containing protein [Nocardioides sp. 31GB23]|uniref:GmrSD restriction endonuclease domain-containing protein n=1 Tax=Nocardioides sp. 31GB23 TaxID=3156065 RepID=UPI0032AE897B
METNVRTPMDVFNLPQHLVVPLFQRPYVWDETDQWLPLWEDVRRMAELRLTDPYTSATHFLGAVVLQAQENSTGNLPARNVIDGQQRLTTLQVLMDAAGAVLDELGLDNLSGQLEILTHNLDLYVTGGGTRLKLRHTNKDHAAFDEVMNADPPINYTALKHSGSLLARAHEFFSTAVEAWVNNASDDLLSAAPTDRATALVQILTRGLQLVVIDLQAQENSQEIFETLNARGTPLTAADLVKNFVFQRLEAEGVDTRRAYVEDWPFESAFWEKDVSVGRYNVSRSSLFITQWLISRSGEEVGPRATFTRFKHYADHQSNQKMSDLLALIKQQADQYKAWTVAAEDPDRALSRPEMAVYRMGAAGIELLKPVLLWLHDPELDIPAQVADEVIAATESWIMRRLMLRLTSSDLGRVIADLIRSNRTTPPDQLAQRVRDYLTNLTAASTYWPGDDEIRTLLATENAYRRFPRARLRMLLEAVEDHLRGRYDYPPVPRRGYHIEHVLPQKWETHWPVDGGLEPELDRAAHVHRLGNLTLLTKGLNSSASNGAWQGKREKVAKHDVFLLNRTFHDSETSTWDESHIDRRSHRMIDELLATWPVPPGHVGEVRDSRATDQTWIEIKHLIAAGLLEPGTTLHPRPGHWAATPAVVSRDGRLEVAGTLFDSPSGAAKHVKGGIANGWIFWRFDDGRNLGDVRAVYRGTKPENSRTGFDWTPMHAILEALPTDRWTTYGDLADAIGTAAQAVGNHLPTCHQCANAHRVLTSDGRVADSFRWTDPDDDRDPAQLLVEDGIHVRDGRAEPARRLRGDDLSSLVEASP